MAQQGVLQAVPGKFVELPDGAFVAEAQYKREGANLQLTSPEGQTIVIEGYFNQNPPPDIVTPDGARLSPALVDSFLPPERIGQYAEAGNTVNDASPAGQITEVVGTVTVVRADGTKVTASAGTPVYPGDVIETSKEGAANILFADNTTFAISESGRLAVNEFSYDATAKSGNTFFSILQGVFVYTSGLIGKHDPHDVKIETPVGSIGIRGTIVAGDINPAGEESKITIVQGAIVVENAAGTIALDNSLETAGFSSFREPPRDMGQIDMQSFSSYYSPVSTVAAQTFTALSQGDYATEATAPGADAPSQQNQPDGNDTMNSGETPPPAASEGAQSAPSTDTSVPEAPVPPAGEAPIPPPPAGSEALLPPTQGSLPPPPVFFAPPPPPPAGTNFGPAPGSTFTGPAPGTTSGSATDGSFIGNDGGSLSGDTSGGTTGSVAGDGTTGTTTVTGSGAPPPNVQFMFNNPHYTKGTATTADDGIPLFGIGWVSGDEIGRAGIQNVPVGTVVTYELAYTTGAGGTVIPVTGGVIQGNVYAYNAATPGDAFDTTNNTLGNVFNFNPTTGAITLVDPLSAHLSGNYNFILKAKAADGTILATHNFVFNSGSFGGDLLLGTGNADNINAANGNTAVMAGAGNDSVTTGTGLFRIFGEDGDDVIFVNPAFGSVDGGAGNDKVVLNGPNQQFDFTQANAPILRNIETIELGGSVNASDVKLTLEDIFEMTGPGHSLTVRTTTGTGRLLIDTDAFSSITGATLVLDTDTNTANAGDNSGTGTVTMTGTYQGVTVTLVVEQGGNTDGVVVSNI